MIRQESATSHKVVYFLSFGIANGSHESAARVSMSQPIHLTDTVIVIVESLLARQAIAGSTKESISRQAVRQVRTYTRLASRLLLLLCCHMVKNLLVLDHLSLQIFNRAVMSCLLLFRARRELARISALRLRL